VVRLAAFAVSAGIGIALGALSIDAGAPAQPQQPIRVGTNLVRVDVYPTVNGQIVAGLTAADFEVLEDGAPQTVATFEHVVPVRGPQDARVEPSSSRDALGAVANGRNRVFLIFLDAPFVSLEGAHAINEPLIRFLRNELSDDDLVGIMTPEMSASNVTFGRRTQVIEESLRSNWDWGRQGRQDPELDKREIQYEMCFPPLSSGPIAAKMAARRRERATLEALQDAVKYLHSVREERKAIVTVSPGWELFREDPEMMRQGAHERPLGVDRIRVGPNGKLTTEDHRNSVNMLPKSACDADRMRLAEINNERFLREIVDDANAGNASFYMIDPGGLSVRSPDRSGALRTLAAGTDGLAVLNTNDLNHAWKRIADDMSSYYLLGYYSTNTKPDGKLRSITVRVRRDGVHVRARRGYRAPTVEETTAARTAPAAAATGDAAAVTTVLERLGRIRPDARFRIHAAATTSGTGALWVAGEIQSTGGRPDEFLQGSTALVEAVGSSASTTARATLKPGERTFLLKLDLPKGAGALDVRARVSSDEGGSPPLTDGVRLEASPSELQPLLFRRGVTTGNRLLPVADLRFSRIERARIEIPIGPGPRDGKAGRGRVMDRGGLPTQVPVVVGERTDDVSGQRWITADVTLGALSPGDYAIEVVVERDAGEQRVLTPIRVVR
jgi:VWFA-related protein